MSRMSCMYTVLTSMYQESDSASFTLSAQGANTARLELTSVFLPSTTNLMGSGSYPS